MALIYPEEAFALYGPKVSVYDARGRRLSFVCACDPLTGEVIEVAMNGRFGYTPRVVRSLRYGLEAWLWSRFGINLNNEIPTIHRFAPAPLAMVPVGPATA